MAVLGIDVGTTAVKAILVAEDGRVKAESVAFLEVSYPHPGWSEQDPEAWWEATCSVVADVMAQAEGVELAAVGLSGQMHSSVFLDADRQVIRPALLWNDVRTTAQCRRITKTLGMTGLRRSVGNLALEGFTAPKVLWLRENEPRGFERLRTLLLPKDYIRLRLTREIATDPSDASGTLFYDVRRRRWSEDVLTALDIRPDILPSVVGSAEVSGLVTAAAAAKAGLPEGVPVVGGGADNAAGAVGSGVVVPGRVQASIGTSGTVLMPVDRPQVDRRMRLHTFCHCPPDLWYLMGTMLSAGSSLRWLRDLLLPGSGDGGYETLTAEASKVALGSEGLLFLPYLAGERTPHNDANARGVFFGLHPGHGRAHLARAVMEGVCYAMRDSLELMRALGLAVPEVRAIGGGSRSRLWLQLMADVFAVPVSIVTPAGGPAFGAALLAAVGAGVFSSEQEAVESCVRVRQTVDPDRRSITAYAALYEDFRALYPTLKRRFADAAATQKRLPS